MMVKVVHIKDRQTSMVAVAIKADPQDQTERNLLREHGVGEGEVGMIIYGDHRFARHHGEWDNDRTETAAHKWLEENFDSINDGDEVDVERILGER